MALTSSTQKELYQFFAIAFDAAPGVTYMSQLADAVNSGMSVKQVVNVFTTKTQFTETYPNFFTTNQFATKLVNNVVGDAATAAAKASAVADIEAALNAGWSRGDVIYQVFTNLANKPTTDATWGNTAKQMANQVAYAQYYTETLLTDTTDLTKLRAVIANVTPDTSIEPAAILAVLVPTTVVPTYALTASAASVDEGSAMNFTLTTTSVTAGTQFSYVISGVAAADVVGGSLTGTATVDSQGKAIIPVTLVSDATTEGAETISLSVANQTATVVVNDTSVTPVAAVATYALAASSASVNEGAGMYFTLTTTNVAAGTIFSYVITGVSSSDVVGGSLTGTATIDSLGSAIISVNLVADATTEGAETITLSVASKTASSTVSDTSTSVVATATTTLGAGIDTVTTADANINIIDGSTTANSLTSSDSVTDNSGTDADKLVARYTSNQTSIRPTLTDVETIVVQSDAANVTMDLTRATGYDNLKVEAQNFTAGNDVLFSNVANGGTTLTVSAMTHINDKVAIQYKDAALVGTNSLSLTLDTVTAGNISLTDAGGTTNTLETIAITTSVGASNFQLIDAGVNFSAITLTGDQDLTLVLSGAGNLSSITGADFAGAFKTDLTAYSATQPLTVVTGSGADSIVGGSGNDSINTDGGADVITNIGVGFDTVSSGAGADSITVAGSSNVAIYGGDDNDTITMATYLSTGDRVDGGAGDDILSVTSNINASWYGTAVSNVETVKLEAANISMTLNSADVTSASGDTIDLSYAGNQSLTLSSGSSSFTGNVNVKLTGHLASDNDSVSAASSLGTINVIGNVGDITQYTSITGGNGSDTLTLTADSNSASANFTSVTKVETVTILANGQCDASITLSSANTAMTIDATALTNTSADLTVLGGAYNGNLTISGGAGADQITAGNGSDAIFGGAGNDTFTFASGTFDSNDTVSGGLGYDTIALANTSIAAGSTRSVSSDIEAIKMTAANSTMTMNSADTSGLTVDMTSAGNQTLTVSSGTSSFAGNVTVKMTGHAQSDNDKVSAANSVGTITVIGSMNDITTYTSITGGNGTDVLLLTADGNETGAVFTSVTKVETVTIVAAGACDAKLTLGTDNTALTINASALTNSSADLNVVGATYTGNMTITGGAGNDTITGGTGVDLIIGGAGNDTLSGCGSDTLSGGSGVDQITISGTGNTSVYGGDGNDTITIGTASYLTAGDVIDGEGNVDTLSLTGTYTKGTLSGLRNIETISLIGDGSNMSLNSADVTAFSTGVTIDLSGAGNQTLLLGANTNSSVSDGFTGSVTVKLTGGAITGNNDKIDATGSAGTITVVGSMNDIGTLDSITGGNGTDVLLLTADGNETGAVFTSVTKVETVTIVAAGACDAKLTLGTDNTALTIDASALTNSSADLNVVGATYTGNMTITGGAGNDTITGGTGVDLIIGGAGNDTLSGCGSDTLSGGTGADQITISGAGATKVYGGDGNDTITSTGYLSGNDVIDGGDGVDTLIIGGAVTAGSLAGVTNVEVIQFSSAGDALTLNQGDVAAFTSNSFTVDMSVTGNQSISFGSGSRAFSGTVYVNMTNSGTGNESVIANSSTGSINVIGNMADLNTSDTLTAGGHSTDVITLTADDNSGGAVLTNVSGFTSITITGVGACDAKLTLGADTESLSITATSMTNSAANLIVLGNVYNGGLTISSGAGADSITGGNGADLIVTGNGADQITTGCGADTVSSGAGDDTITISGTGMAEISAGDGNDTISAGGYLSYDDIITGGSGFDTIAISSTTSSSGFYQSSGFEKVTLSGANTTLTLASNDSAAFVLSSGYVTIDMDEASNQSLVLGNGALGFTGNVLVEIGSPGASLNDSVLAGGSLATFTVNGSVADIGSGVTITGGNGTDTLTLLADDGAATLTNVTKVEQITVTGIGTCDATLTLGSDSTAMTITATSMSNTSANLWIKGASYTGALTISAGAGVDSITGGSGADNINGGAGHDLIVGGAGADTIFGGAGNDTITGGAGGDMLYGGTGCDTFYFSGNGVVSLDTIEDFVSGTGNDQIQIGNAAGFTWGNEAAGFHYSSDGLSNNYALIVLNESSSFDSAASASALADQLFVNNGVNDADGGAYVFIWQDSSSVVHISYGESVTGADSYKDVVKLVGVSLSTLLTNLGTGNIDLTS